MKKEDVKKLPLGLYLVTWNEGGGQSLAAVGMLKDGRRWIAPVNWTQPPTSKISLEQTWLAIESVKLLAVAADDREPEQPLPVCEHCRAGDKPWLASSGFWRHTGGVNCQTPEKNCVCHSGSVCTEACAEGKHHEGCTATLSPRPCRECGMRMFHATRCKFYCGGWLSVPVEDSQREGASNEHK